MKNKIILLIIFIILIIFGYFVINNLSNSDLMIIETVEGLILTDTDENEIKQLISNDFFKNENKKCKKMNTKLSLNKGSWSSEENINAVVICNCVFDDGMHTLPGCISKRYDIGKVDSIWTIIQSGAVGWE